LERKNGGDGAVALDYKGKGEEKVKGSPGKERGEGMKRERDGESDHKISSVKRIPKERCPINDAWTGG